MREMSDMELLSKLEGEMDRISTYRRRLGAERGIRNERFADREEQAANEQGR